jgi:hypothetical protein
MDQLLVDTRATIKAKGTRRWRRDDGRQPRHAEMEPQREFKEYGLVGPTGGER